MPINFNAQGTVNNMGLLGPTAPGMGQGPGQGAPLPRMQRGIPPELMQRPEPGWGQVIGASLGGPAGVNRMYRNTEAPWRGNVAQYISRELLEGRPAWKPLHPMEVHGLIQQIDPRLNSDPQFQQRMQYWVQSWNRSAMATQAKMLQAQGINADRAKTYGGNMAKYGGPVDPNMVPAMRGYGYGGLLGPAPGAVATESATPNARSQYYVQPESRRSAQAEADKERMLGPVRTANEVAKRKALNQVPTAQWMEGTDQATGNKYKEWSGGLLGMNLGRAPKTTAEMGADQVREALASGQKPAAGTVQGDVYNRAVSPDSALAIMQILAKSGLLGNADGPPKPSGGQKTVPYSKVKATAQKEKMSEGQVIKDLQNAGYTIDWTK